MSADIGPPLNRRELIAGGVAGAASAMLVAAVGRGAAHRRRAPVSVTDRLQRLIRIELLLLFSYRHVLGSSILTPATQQRLSPFAAHEQAHIAALEQRLRARGAPSRPGHPMRTAANRYLAHRKIGGRLGQLRGDLTPSGCCSPLSRSRSAPISWR